MRGHDLVGVAKGLSNAVEKGLVTGEAFAKSQLELATQMFPNETSPYRALARLLDTNVGKVMTAKAAQANYERIQKASACGDGYEAVLKMNERASPVGVDEKHNSPKPHFDDSHSGAVDSDDDDDGEPIDDQIKRLMGRGLTYDQAVSRAHRSEKLRKGL
jgi:hypothetical protein